MPVHTIGRNGDFRHQIGSTDCDSSAGRATQRNPANDSVVCRNLFLIEELPERLSLGIGRNRGRQSHSKTMSPSPLNPFACACPGASPAMQVVQFRRRAVQTDLQHNSIARQRSQALSASSGKEHSISQHRGRSGRSASEQNLANIFQQKGLAAGHEDFFDPQLHRFTGDPLHPCEPQFPSRRGRRRPHAAVVAMQVAVEVRVQPKPRTHRPIVFCRCPSSRGNNPASEDPARAAIFRSGFHKWISGKSAPRFQLRSNALVVTDQRHQITRTTAAQHSDQLRQQTRRKGLGPDIQIDVSLHWHACILQSREHSAPRAPETAAYCATYCAAIHLSDPVTLTATSENQIRMGMPSALPRRSVEMSRGPAFFWPPHVASTMLGFLAPPRW